MKDLLIEVRSSWSHCKELLNTDASMDLVVAFLEDFKSQFTQLYKQMKQSGLRMYERASLTLVDRARIFWKQEGELSKLIYFVKKNWHKKAYLLKKISAIDRAISRIFEYAQQKITA